MPTRAGLLRAAPAQLGIVTLLLLGAGLATFWSVADAVTHARLVVQDHDLLARIDAAFSGLNRVETELRRYARSNDAEALTAARKGLIDLQDRVARLRVLRAPEAGPGAVPTRIDGWIHQILTELPARGQTQHAAFDRTLESSAFQTAVSRIRVALSLVQSDVRTQLRARAVDSETSNRLLTALTFVDLLAFVLALAVGYQLIARELARRGSHEAGLRSLLADVSDMYERAPCGYLSQDPDGTVTRINDTALAWLGYRRAEIVGRLSTDELFAPEDLASIRAHFAALQRQGHRFENACRMRCRDGSLKDVLLSATAVHDTDGRLIVIRSIFVDITAHKHAEESLRLSEERFRGAFDGAAIGMALVGQEGRFLQVNRSLCDIVGYSEDELLARTFQDITHPKDLEADLAHVGRLLAGESRSYRMEKRYVHKNGDIVYVVLSVSLLRDTAGLPVHFVVQVEDITEHKRVEGALRESEERFRNVSDSAPVMIWMGCLMAGTFTFLNRTGLEFLGDAFDGIQGRGWLERVHADDRLQVESTYREAATLRQPVTTEFRLRRADGQYRWIGASATPRFLPNGAFAGYIGTMIDISERKEAEDAWRACEARFHAFMNHSPAVAFMKDHEGRILYVNETMERAFNVRLTDIRDQHAFPGLPADVVEQAHRNDRAVLDSGRPAQSLEVVPSPSGEMHVWQMMRFPFHDAQNRLLLGGIAVDVTEQKELELRLARANSRLEVLASSDSLTGLSNRRTVGEGLEKTFALACRHLQPLSILMIDVDHFKPFNDSFGHPAGDQVLAAIGGVLRSTVRSSDVAGRYGGEEFIVVLPETDAAGAVELAERLREAISAVSWPLRPITISIGAASLEATTPNPLALVTEADRALYESKRRGRNRVTHIRSVHADATERNGRSRGHLAALRA